METKSRTTSLPVLLISYTILTVCLLGLLGCAKNTVVAPPTLYTQGIESSGITQAPLDRQKNEVELFYVTDRERVIDEEGQINYTEGRSEDGYFGKTTLSFNDSDRPITWDELTDAAIEADGYSDVRINLNHIDELGVIDRFQGNKYVLRGDQWMINPDYVINEKEQAAKLNRAISNELAQHDKKEVYIYVHGVSTTFETANFALAQIWHFMGRQGMPLVYTWPAGSSGILRAYNYDRESSEFTVRHFKLLLQLLADHQDVEKVHIISHSRGTDVVIAALRELHIYHEGAGRLGSEELKLGQVILAAPDLDLHVLMERFDRGGAYIAPEQMTVYFSTNDLAIDISSWLFSSEARVGNTSIEEMDQEKLAQLADRETLSAIRVTTDHSLVGHGYFYGDPHAFSDLILVLRDGRKPGEENGRPLEPIYPGVWSLNEGYPNLD